MLNFLLVAVGGGGLGATVVGVLNALLGKRKMSADAAAVIEESASSAVKRVDADNKQLRERLEKLEGTVEELRGEIRSRDRRIDELDANMRSKDRRIDELSDELVAFREYSIELRDALQSQDPTLRLPEPPARIARHFLPP